MSTALSSGVAFGLGIATEISALTVETPCSHSQSINLSISSPEIVDLVVREEDKDFYTAKESFETPDKENKMSAT